MKQFMTFCTTTIKHFKTLINKDHNALLIGIKGGGCNGLKYYIEPTSETPDRLDEVIDKEGVKIVICGKSIMHLLGSEIKWKEDFMGSRIEFTNPNAKGSCGCGESWSF